MRFAIIDLGTNTFKLLVAQHSGGDPGLRVLHEEEVGVFLGRDGIERGVLAADAMDRGMGALRTLAARAKEFGAERVNAFGTSAMRNARNGAELVARIQAELGILVSIIPGEDEAGLILDGVRQVVTFGAKPALVMDIGGGSTEFILATDKALMWKHSFELGTTRLFERFPAIDPMNMDTQLRMAQHIDAQLEGLWAVMDRHWPATLIGSAGSFDTIAHLVALQRGTPLAPGATTLGFDATEFDALKDRIVVLDRAQRLLLPGMPAHRSDTILPALMLIERVLLHGIQRLEWSSYSLKEGAAARLCGLAPLA
ncbi:MAG: hypothetical protein KBH07_04020 [Flavobacteriales bacterium]|nr:hypothetical protein [Flavobacteriales bacterium]MBP9078982.1 hypothetical protein [Flavobacteriales bacterium]